ncbi:MAG: type 1 glutamine amidotransferase [Methylophilaceae bacterium]
MKPVIIFRYALTEGAGFLIDFFDKKHIPWRLLKVDAGEQLPLSVREFSAVVLMGGTMSVNDDLPWIPPMLALIREAVEADIPLLGHCLGGQLISKALGGSVTKNALKEFGWGEVSVADNAEAKRWFGALAKFQSFHWHGETFSLPVGATHLLSSAYCQNQAFSLGKHLAFQCHIEMTAEMIASWCKAGAHEVNAALASPGVQSLQEIQSQLESRVAALNLIAEAVYTRWLSGLAQ